MWIKLIDAQLHNYSPECGGCYNCNSCTRAFEQYYTRKLVELVSLEC